MESIHLTMINDKLEACPSTSLSGSYSFRKYTEGDELHWARVEAAAGEFSSVEEGLRQFGLEFAPYKDEMRKRCIFLEHESNGIIGTATAWYSSFQGAVIGRLHWVGIHPDFQGRKLARPLVEAAVNTLAQYHEKGYLTTQTTSFKAIKIYLDLGFTPYLTSESCRAGWKLLTDLLNHPALTEFE